MICKLLYRFYHNKSNYNTDIPDELKNTKTVKLRISYFAGGIVNVYKQWFMGELDCNFD